MEQDHKCVHCNVSLSSDLSNCPLCGKFVGEKAKENENSYPIYDLKKVQKNQWYNTIRILFWAAGLICVATNLIFWTTPLWCPYVVAFLVVAFHAFIQPIKTNVKSYIKELNIISILVSLFIIFVDAYNHYSFKTEFGWSLSLVAPSVMTGAVITSVVICFCKQRYEQALLRSISFIAFYSVIYFVIKIIFFKNLMTWPSLMFMCCSVGAIFLLEAFKRNKVFKELSREFHI